MILKEYRKILCPVDGHRESLKGFDIALNLCKLTGAELSVLYVVDVDQPVLGGIETDLYRESRYHGRKLLDSLKEEAKKTGISISTFMRTGEAAPEIIEVSKDYDLIIMGTRGRSTLASVIMGSVADRVLREACCPVLLTRLSECDRARAKV